jgi:hypothetical protein
MKTWDEVASLFVLVPMLALAGCEGGPGGPLTADGARAAGPGAAVGAALVPASFRAAHATMPVEGSVVHFLSTAVIHSQEPTETGMIQRSTEVVELTGDLEGYLLYHPTSTFDFVNQTLVNTGTQVFSGTVAGSDPIILHDDRFRFEVDLSTGETIGTVHLSRSNDAPDRGGWYECDLEVIGTGMNPDGDATADYSGVCRRLGTPG